VIGFIRRGENLLLRLLVLSGFCLTVVTVGCGGSPSNLVEVGGKVLIDGKPLTTGRVNTLPANGRGAQGAINSEGEFTLSSGDLGPGALIGTHHVAVIAVEETTNFSPEAPQRSLIPQRYARPETSGLTIDVKADEPNEVVLELTSKP
jgi:hypothetical protein